MSWSIILGVLASIATAVATILGVALRKARVERGLMMRNGRTLVLDSSRLPLWFGAPTHWTAAFNRACATINEAAGADIARVTKLDYMPIDSTGLFVPVRQRDKGTTGHAILQVNPATGAIRHIEIILPQVDVLFEGVDARDRIALHECLHAFGFDHDDDPASVMFPSVRKTSFKITAADVELLREIAARM
jgi:hypothetical protein